ncbi:hypothetical protein LTR51_002324 [Lithohypha guttulata]|nr:hypothetical protein LTR51_002324 [Lithohypha guttulata]
MAAQTVYQPLEVDDAEVAGESPNVKYTYNDFSDDEEDDGKLRLLEAPENSARQRKAKAWCACSSLSKACIAACAAVALVTLLLIGSGGYFAYKQGLIDGQSPPWYPSPNGGTVSTWADSYAKAQKLVEQMTLVEKVNVTTGTGWAMDLCVGTTGRAGNTGFPALCLQDGPLGIRFADHADSFPAGITVGSTWNRELMRKRGEAHGRAARLKGVHVLLGPAMGPIGRNPAGGRNWEGFGSDPVLQAVAAAETIKGIQSQGVQATAKHFVGNEQEHFRKSFEWGLPEALSSNIGDRALHEIYAWPFAESIRAGVASIMCSYQMVNNSYACQNSWLLNGMLKDELGFQGYVQSDWLAQRSGVASALAGLDMSMPGDGLFWQDGKPLFGSQLTLAVLNGSVPVQRLNDMATRIVAAWYQVGQDSREQNEPNFSSWTNETVGKWHDGADDSDDTGVVNQYVETSTAETRKVARQVAHEGTVLLKNEDALLPLNYHMRELNLERKAKVIVVGEDGGPAEGGPNHCADRACNDGTLASGWGSGASEFPYLVDPFVALHKSFDAGAVELSRILKNKLSAAEKQMIKEQDLCLVLANADAGEGYLAWNGVYGDRNDLELQKGGANLIKDVAALCGGPVIAIVHSVGPVIMEEFADLPNIKSIVLANLPGQESGNALADVLFGRVDASGRLPYTIGRSLADYGQTAPVLYYPNHIVPQVDFKEGLYIDYRHFDKQGLDPRYEFGYGLSYTTFEYSNSTIESLKAKSPLPAPRLPELTPPDYKNAPLDPETAMFPDGFRRLRKYIYPWITSAERIRKVPYPYPLGYDTKREPSQAGGGEGGNPSLFENHVKITVRVTNKGARKGQEVVQVYVSFPENVTDPVSGEHIDMPVRVLRNFEKIDLRTGETKTVEMFLTRKDLSYWSVAQQNWIMPDDEITIHIGRSSRDLRYDGTY